jgi:hypothetical protein
MAVLQWGMFYSPAPELNQMSIDEQPSKVRTLPRSET